MGLKLIPPGQGSELREYYIRFEGSMYGVLHVDNEAHTVSLVPLKELDNISVFIEPLDPYKLHGVRVFDSSSFRMVLCFFDARIGVRQPAGIHGGDAHVFVRCGVVSACYGKSGDEPVADVGPGGRCGHCVAVRFLSLGGRRQPRPVQYADPGSLQAVERGRRLLDVEAGSGLLDRRRV